MWMASLGGVALYEADLPSCCRRAARQSQDGTFECSSCGAGWQEPEPIEPEACAFMERRNGDERKGAA